MGRCRMTSDLPSKVYRVARRDHASSTADALSGAGGLYSEGRWHSLGHRIVYSSQSTTLCLLERLVHADEWIAERHPDRIMLSLTVPDVSVYRYEAAELSARDPLWRREGSLFCRRLGDLWLAKKASCALMVPSAANQADFNILFNPEHPEFAQLLSANDPLISAPVELDERIVELARQRRRAAI